MLFDLKPNENLLNKNTIIETHKSYNSTTIKKAIRNEAPCHYQGSIRDFPDSALGVSLCYGMVSKMFY
jgi:hypothetical protein